MRGTLRITLVTLAATTLVAGCGGDEPRPQTNDTVSYGSVGKTAQIDCGAGKSLEIAGSNNSLTVVGACWSVEVGGADNRIRLDRIDGTLSVTGLNNTVDYLDGEPTVRDEGSGNRINRG